MKYIDILLAQKLGGGGNPEITVEELNVTENGTYVAGAGKAYNPVKVSIDVPEIEQLEATENTTYTAPEGKAYGSVVVNVPSSSQTLDEVIQGTATSVTSNATSIKSGFFRDTSTLLEANFPEVLLIGSDAFNTCTNLKTIVLPKVTTLQSYVFLGCSSLIEVNFPELTTLIGSGNFNGCSKLETVNFPKMTTMSNSCFSNCKKLVNVNIGNLQRVKNAAFYNCEALELIDFDNVSYLEAQCFYNCSKLNTVILRKDQVCTLENINAFNNTPFASGGTGGILYVPESKINSYKRAAGWSTILDYENNQILAIEGSVYE